MIRYMQLPCKANIQVFYPVHKFHYKPHHGDILFHTPRSCIMSSVPVNRNIKLQQEVKHHKQTTLQIMRQTHVLGFPTSFCEFSGSFSVPDNSIHASSNAVLVTLYVKHSISPDLFPCIRNLGNGRINCCTNCVVTLSLLFALQKVPFWFSTVSCPNRNLFQHF